MCQCAKCAQGSGLATAVANERCEIASMVIIMHADEAHANYENELAAEGAGGGGAATHAGTSTFRFALCS